MLAATKPLDLAAVAFRRSPRSPIAASEHGLTGPFAGRDGRRTVLEALGCSARRDALLDELAHHVDQRVFASPSRDDVPDVDPARGFGDAVVDLHMAVVARRRCLGAGFERANGPQPLVDTNGHTRVWQYDRMIDTDPDSSPGAHHINDPRWPARITVACANFASMPREKDASVTKLIDITRDGAAGGADLVVFPELAINTWGGCRECADAHAPCEWHLGEAEAADGPSARRIAAAAAELGVHVIYGFEETGDTDGVIHNSANLIGPEGLIGTYRKLHLGIPLETDRFTPGEELPVFDTALGPIGISICYDFYNNPELSRLLCFKGARLLVNPTGRSDLPHARENLTHATLVRAQENLVYAASSNRVGDTHGGSTWAGGSVIGGPDFPGFGVALAAAGADEELICAELDFERAARWHDWLPWTEWRIDEQRPITELVQREFAALLDGGG